jgi:hypothetical protein
MRAALEALGAPADLLQCVERPSIPLSQALMAGCDLTIATGGPPMVRAAYSSGKPAYGVGAGNADDGHRRDGRHQGGCDEYPDQQDERPRIRMFADGNLVVDASIYDAILAELERQGGHIVNAKRRHYSGRRTGTNRDAALRTPSPGLQRLLRPRRGFQLALAKPSSSSPRTRSEGNTWFLRRSWESFSRSSSTQALTRPSTLFAAFLRRAGAATRAESTRSTTSTFTGWR